MRFPRSMMQISLAVMLAPWIASTRAEDAETLAHWRFEGTPGEEFTGDKSGVVLAGEAGTQAEASNRPTYGAPVPEAGGGSSLLLSNGLATDNNGVFALSDALKEMKGMSGLTVEAWINPATIKESSILRSVGQSGVDKLSLTLRADGSVCFQITHMGTDYAVVSPSGSIVENEWCHVAGVFGADGPCIFIDGRLVASRQKGMFHWPEIQGTFGRLGIGAYVRTENLSSTGLFFDGQIDEIHITGRALPPAEFFSTAAQ